LIPYQNVLWLSNAVLQASIVILTVVTAFLTFFLTFTWSYLQKARKLEKKESEALDAGRSLAKKILQAWKPEIVRVYDSWFKEKFEDAERVIDVVSRHPVISRINARQRLLLFLVGPRFLAEFLPIATIVVALLVFIFMLARKWIYLRTLWVVFSIFSGMPIAAVRKGTLSFPLISPILFFYALWKSSPFIKAFRKCGITEFKIGKLGTIGFKTLDAQMDKKYFVPEITEWAVLHEASRLLPSELLFPVQLDFMKQFGSPVPPLGLYPRAERVLFKKAKEKNMPKKFKQQLRDGLKRHEGENEKDLKRFVAQITHYNSLHIRLSIFLKIPGRIILKVVVGLLIFLCATAAILSLFAISGTSSSDLISGNLIQIATGLLISAIIGLLILVAILLRSF